LNISDIGLSCAGLVTPPGISDPRLPTPIVSTPPPVRGYVTTQPGICRYPRLVSGPLGILALPLQVAAQIATLPFRVLVSANGTLAPTATALVPANPEVGVVYDWNGRYTSVCGL
jgi:hypothetical protein